MESITTKSENKNRPVSYGEFLEVLNNLIKTISETQINSNEEIYKMFELISNKIVEVIETTRYERQRDLHYFIEFASANGYGSRDDLFNSYFKWCEEFDKLNKNEEA